MGTKRILFNHPSIVGTIKAQILRWMRHVERKWNMRVPKKLLSQIMDMGKEDGDQKAFENMTWTWTPK